MILFHRQPNGNVAIDYNGRSYQDSVTNLELDSGEIFTDAGVEIQVWEDGKRCVIENGSQKPVPDELSDAINAVLANLVMIVDAKQDREANTNWELNLLLNGGA